jgi:methylated-DNA-protein-cysteine methyltransferase-like protein
MADTSSVALAINHYVSMIPRGKITTYKQVAESVGIHNYRQVGFVLHQNRDPEKIPCHRVVKRNGILAKGYSMGGETAQKKLLKSEGIVFSKNGKIKLADFFWKG